MKNLITALLVLSQWYAYAQPSDYLTEIDGNVDITDTATIANENVMILNRYLDFSNEFSSAGGINLYEKVGQLFALNQNKREKSGYLRPWQFVVISIHALILVGSKKYVDR